MGKRDRKCYLCGESYKYCGTCSQDKMKPAWMSEFHSESCKNIFDIATRFNMGMMSKIEAQDALKDCDLSNKSNFKSYVQRDLENIFAEEHKKRGKRAELKLFDEAIGIEPIVVQSAIENIVEESHVVVEKEKK